MVVAHAGPPQHGGAGAAGGADCAGGGSRGPQRVVALRAAQAAQGIIEAAAAYQEARAGDYDDDVCEARAQEVCAQVVNWRANRDA